MKQPPFMLLVLEPFRLPLRRSQHYRRFALLALGVLLGLAGSMPVASGQNETDQPSEESMALYADAANFQTGGALDVAIKTWNQFLTKYPEHPMAANAAHFLGVCHMQSDPPDYVAASRSFAKALQKKKYDLREESLVNYGWCLYASAGDEIDKDPKRLRTTLVAFRELIDSFPESKFLDRAYFYSGESAYGLGQIEQAVQYYNKLLAMRDAAKSPLHCDALYARGVAFEELKQPDRAIDSYKQLLATCKRQELIGDVQLRIGDLMIMQGNFDQAVAAFDRVQQSADTDEDRAYALFRQAYALVQSEQPTKAAATYDRLLKSFPDSPYAASAILASAQSSYRGGDMTTAEQRFREVRKQQNLEAATEATHWLARIYLSKADNDQAIKVTRDQLNRGLEGDFAISVRLDLAEALANDPKTVEDSLVLFEEIYRSDPRDRRAPRALYNAAFSALQIGQPEKALKLAGEFIRTFPKDTLVSDIRFVAAESQLATGEGELAADTYRYLLASSEKDNVQRPMWVLRAAAASNSANQWDKTISLLGSEIARLPQPDQKSEAYQLIGQAHLQAGRPSDAVNALRKSFREESAGPRSERTLLLLGQALLADEKPGDAEKTWQQLVDNASSPAVANQARYRVAQAAAAANRFDQAIRFYDQILKQNPEPQLLPYIQYGKGWAHLQLKQYKTAFDPLDQMLRANADHPLRGDATLARGIALRNLGQLKEARKDLQDYLSSQPEGINLGHSLYELALIDQQSKQPGDAAKKLERLVRDVPDYPSMDQVLYELGWSLQESGDAKRAVQYFDKLIKDYPDNALIAESAYFIGQQFYAAKDWKSATDYFAIAAQKPGDPVLNEKSYYRLGWSYYNLGEYDQSETSFASQARKHPEGSFAFDAMAMVGESRFKQNDFQGALTAYDASRQWVRTKNETSKSLRDQAERQIRELTFLHGGQSAAQLKQWDVAIGWYDELRKRFPTTAYLPQVFYETGFAYQQSGKTDDALKFFGEVADNYRNELAARARFMMGEIYFADKEFDKAIPEFQRVMFGFGAEKAPESIKNWQAKSGFEAARCSELLMQTAKTSAAKEKARKMARDFFTYVIEKHPQHELAKNSRQLLEGLQR